MIVQGISFTYINTNILCFGDENKLYCWICCQNGEKSLFFIT